MKNSTDAHSDPHAFMGRDHPDISGSMQIPAGGNTPEMQRALDASVVKPPLSWLKPEGWTEQKGRGMRLATFQASSKYGPIECTIISLGGQAGGLASNVSRWMGQINAQALNADQMHAFLSRQEDIPAKGDLSLKLIDLTEWTDAQQPSMIAAVAELEHMTIFVKMTGSHNAIDAQRDQFKGLCRSLKIE